MQIVIDIPDKYLIRWDSLRERVNMPDLNSFILNAIGIGVKTVDQATRVLNPDTDNVIEFDKDYYWKSFQLSIKSLKKLTHYLKKLTLFKKSHTLFKKTHTLY